MKNRMRITAFVTAAAIATMTAPLSAEATSNLELRTKVISSSGILSSNFVTSEYITRGEFAQMLVNATSYKSVASQTCATAVFSDVSVDSGYAYAIKIAVENGWMTGYLGGVFRPENPITLQEAARGILALLGYTDNDFTGDQLGGRFSKFQYLDLGEDIGKQAQELLTRTDCVNLFYNLLRTETTSGQAYGTTLGYQLSADGEINPLTIVDNGLKGPKVVTKSYSIDDSVPFRLSEATFYLDGRISSLERLNQEKREGGFIVIYYNTANKTIWAYSSAQTGDEANTSMVAIRGTVTGIYYNSAQVLTPTTVILEDNTDNQYQLSNSDVQFAFSIYGQYKVGDHVILVCEVTQNSNGDYNYQVVDCVDY